MVEVVVEHEGLYFYVLCGYLYILRGLLIVTRYIRVNVQMEMVVTCKPSWRTARAAYREVVLRGAYVCVLHIKPFFLLARTRCGWHPRE